MSYDPHNVFAQILRAELPCERVYEDEFVLAFKDLHPKAPTHVLVIPKGPYVSFIDFTVRASLEEVTNFFSAVAKITENLRLTDSGYRLVTNSGPDSGQEVPHFHMHILGGKRLGGMA
jgi:histidine triad (HIT) family protein